MTFAAEAGRLGGLSDSGGDSADRDSIRPAPTISLASTATTVQPSTVENGAGSPPATGDSHGSDSGGEFR